MASIVMWFTWALFHVYLPLFNRGDNNYRPTKCHVLALYVKKHGILVAFYYKTLGLL